MSTLAIPTRRQVRQMPKVKEFLDAKARDSYQTEQTYSTALTWFSEFVIINHPDYTISTIIEPLTNKTLEPYDLLDRFITYMNDEELGPSAIKPYFFGTIAYLMKYGVDLNPYLIRQRVAIPKIRREDQYPIDVAEARMILSNISGKRLRPFVFHLAAFGARPIEICALRWKDVDRSRKPYKYYLRAEFSKNKLPREVYGTAESDHELDVWKGLQGEVNPDDLVFAPNESKRPQTIYSELSHQFGDLLDKLGMGLRAKKEGRRKITFYSFRRYVETTVEDHTSENFADYVLGHKKSPYYNKKEPERRQLWEDECHAHLIYLDYNAVEKFAKSAEQERDQALKERDTLLYNQDHVISELFKRIEGLERR